MFYFAAGLALSAVRAVKSRKLEAPLRRDDVPPLLAVVALGGIIAPVLLLVGLSRVTAVTGALLLNLEAPFTIALAVLVFREHIGLRVAVAAVMIVFGALPLKVAPGAIGAMRWVYSRSALHAFVGRSTTT